jgi:hypothetical protein
MADPAYIDDDGVLTDGEAWVALASTTVTSATYNITFTSPNDGSSLDWGQFMDLILITYAQCANTAYGNNQMRIRLNNISSSTYGIYSWQGVRGDGSSVVGGSSTYGYMATTRIPGAKTSPVDQTKMFGSAIHHFFDINSAKAKTLMVTGASDASGTSGNIEMNIFTFYGDGPVGPQAPITEIDIEQLSAEDYSVGSRFDLFGVLPSMLSAGTTA